MSAGGTGDDVAKDAKGFAEDFLGILGLLDIVFGGLALYWVRVAFPATAGELPSSGFAFVDVALLACAAAVTGKLVSLIADGVMAVVWGRVTRRETGEYPPVRSALADLQDLMQGTTTRRDALATPAPWQDVLSDALAHVCAVGPGERARMERLVTRAEFTYGVAVLVALFAWHFARHGTWWLGLLGALAVLLLSYSGHVQQRAYLVAVRAALVRAHSALLFSRASAPAKSGSAPTPG